MEKKINAFIIDTDTSEAKAVVRRLTALKSSVTVRNNGEYCHCRGWSQIYVESTMTEEEIDHWLWATKGVSGNVVSVPMEEYA